MRIPPPRCENCHLYRPKPICSTGCTRELQCHARIATAHAQSGEPYRAAIASITVHGSIAVADLREANYQGMDFIDVFGLLRTEGRWQIVTKCYQQLS